MGHCDTCKYWRAFEEPGRKPYDVDEIVGFTNRLGLCEGIGKLREQREPETDDPAYPGELSGTPKTGVLAAVEDLSNEGFLRTAAKFGCVLWEPKP